MIEYSQEFTTSASPKIELAGIPSSYDDGYNTWRVFFPPETNVTEWPDPEKSSKNAASLISFEVKFEKAT